MLRQMGRVTEETTIEVVIILPEGKVAFRSEFCSQDLDI